jgi:MFS family permease
MAIFYVAYEVGLGLGSFSLQFVHLETVGAPMIGIVFAALSILPVGMTRLRPPPAPESASVALRRAWAISPVGIAGMLAVGGLSMLVWGFAPIHATAIGFTQADVAKLLFAMPIGTLLLQIPLGWISDRTDRRFVIMGTSALVMAGGIVASQADGKSLAIMLLIYLVWSGATESIYSLSSAHANDRAEPGDMVTLASTMLFSWSLSGTVVPALATALTAVWGTDVFMYVAVVIAGLFCLFVAWRTARRQPAPSAASFSPMTAHAPLPVELAFTGEEPRPAANENKP